MEDDIFKIIQDASVPRPIERRASFTSKLIGNAKDWIHGINRRYSESGDGEMYARSYSSGDNFEGMSDLLFRKRSQSITGENPIKEEVKVAMMPGPVL